MVVLSDLVCRIPFRVGPGIPPFFDPLFRSTMYYRSVRWARVEYHDSIEFEDDVRGHVWMSVSVLVTGLPTTFQTPGCLLPLEYPVNPEPTR